MKSKCYLLLVYTFFLLPGQHAAAQFSGKRIYYFIVANEHYTLEFERFEDGFAGLHNLPEASLSADYMKDLFISWDAIGGVMMKSTNEKLLDSKRIYKSLDSLLAAIKKAKIKNAAVFFYYAGHGFSSSKLQALYLPNGDFTRKPGSIIMEDWDKYSTVALDLHEKLQNAKLPHLMFFDCCYSGRQDTVPRLTEWEKENFGLETFDKLMGDTYYLLTSMFQMVGPNPVIFSTKAGDYVTTVPFDTGTETINVAPLCRRALLLQKVLPPSVIVDIKGWMKAFLDTSFDRRTATAVSYWVPADKE